MFRGTQVKVIFFFVDKDKSEDPFFSLRQKN